MFSSTVIIRTVTPLSFAVPAPAVAGRREVTTALARYLVAKTNDVDTKISCSPFAVYCDGPGGSSTRAPRMPLTNEPERSVE